MNLEQVRVRLVKDVPLLSDEPVDKPWKAVKLLAKEIADLDRELVCVVNLQSDLKPINYTIASIGSLNMSYVGCREVFKTAILSNAASCIILHNHPSGRCLPSIDDFNVTKKLAWVGKLLDIPLLDHLIIGSTGSFYSMKDERVLPKAEGPEDINLHELWYVAERSDGYEGK